VRWEAPPKFVAPDFMGEKVLQMKRLTAITAALILSVLTFAGTVGATKPFMQRLPQGPDTLDACSFPVLLQPTGAAFTNLFIFSDGEIMGSGAFVGTAINLDTGKTVTINEGGSFSVVVHDDGSVTVTSNGFVISSLFGTIFSGHSVIELDANGEVTSRTFNGNTRDLCAELADP
jgi:hypothetical protein